MVSVKESKSFPCGLRACPRQAMGSSTVRAEHLAGAGAGVVVVVVAATTCCALPQAHRGHRGILSGQQPCELDVKIPVV